MDAIFKARNALRCKLLLNRLNQTYTRTVRINHNLHVGFNMDIHVCIFPLRINRSTGANASHKEVSLLILYYLRYLS